MRVLPRPQPTLPAPHSKGDGRLSEYEYTHLLAIPIFVDRLCSSLPDRAPAAGTPKLKCPAEIDVPMYRSCYSTDVELLSSNPGASWIEPDSRTNCEFLLSRLYQLELEIYLKGLIQVSSSASLHSESSPGAGLPPFLMH